MVSCSSEEHIKMTTFKLEQYINFSSLEELNYHVQQHVKNNQLNDTQYKLLTILSQHSVKYLGASYLKVSTLMSLLDVSKSTIKRSLKALVEKGIVTKHHVLRPVRGGWGANIYIINQYIETTNEPSELNPCSKSETSSGSRLLDRIEKEETTSSKSLNLKYLVTPKSSINREYNMSYKDVCPSHIPLALGNKMLKFFDSATTTRLYYSIMNALDPYKGRADYDSERLQELAERGFNALMTAIKNHNYNPEKYSKVKNIFSYAYMSTLRIAVNDEFSDLYLYR